MHIKQFILTIILSLSLISWNIFAGESEGPCSTLQGIPANLGKLLATDNLTQIMSTGNVQCQYVNMSPYPSSNPNWLSIKLPAMGGNKPEEAIYVYVNPSSQDNANMDKGCVWKRIHNMKEMGYLCNRQQ